jgi:ComF family protein
MKSIASPFLLRLLWPARCVACRIVVDEQAVFCDDCLAGAQPLEGGCAGCAMPTEGGQGDTPRDRDSLCRWCRVRPFPFREARAVFVYGGTVAEAIVRFKHGKQLAPARPLGRCLVPLLDWAAHEGLQMIVPVPLHPRRLRSRGFNQASELAAAALAAHHRSWPTRRLQLGADLLQRRRDTPPLGRESPMARRHRVAGAFAVRNPERIAGERLLVLDDVMTTGATLAECAQTLLDAGAADVRVAALARAF